MLLTWGSSQGLNSLMNSAEFIAGFADKGSGEVDLVLSRGTGSATFTRATTATTVNSAGTIISVASGTPRSYYDPTTLQYLGYLSEGARTNIALQSADFGTTWVPARASVSTNSVASPDGGTNADSLIEDSTAANTHLVDQSVTFSAAVHTYSVFAKANTRSWIALFASDGVTGRICYFNVSAGTVGTPTNCTGTIKAYPNGWYRCTITSSSAFAAAAGNIQVRLSTGDGGDSYSGNGTSGLYIWGAQLEAASFPSTYIPTTTASVTRNADVLTYPFAGNALDTVGSAYAEMLTFSTTGNGTSSIPLALSASGLMMYLNSSDARTASNLFDGTNSATKTGLSDISTATRKRGCSWGGLGLINTGDGLTPATSSFDGSMGSTSIAVGSTNAGASQWFGTIRNVRIWQTQLSASQLQAVTG